jgi:hypothetical protein
LLLREIAVCLSPPGMGGVAPRSGDGVGPSPFHRSRVPEPGMTTASKIAVCRANGDLTPAPLHAWRGENGSGLLLREIAVCLSPPGTGGVAPRSGDGVGPSPFHRSRVPETGMTTASKIAAAGRTATSPPTPLRKRRGENRSSSLLRGNRRLPLPSRNGRGGPPQAGRGRAVAFSSFQSAGTRHDDCSEHHHSRGYCTRTGNYAGTDSPQLDPSWVQRVHVRSRLT